MTSCLFFWDVGSSWIIHANNKKHTDVLSWAFREPKVLALENLISKKKKDTRRSNGHKASHVLMSLGRVDSGLAWDQQQTYTTWSYPVSIHVMCHYSIPCTILFFAGSVHLSFNVLNSNQWKSLANSLLRASWRPATVFAPQDHLRWDFSFKVWLQWLQGWDGIK